MTLKNNKLYRRNIKELTTNEQEKSGTSKLA